MIREDRLPLVSCIMPTYNRRRFVPHAIRYFLRQEYQHKELIIIDDGTDCISDLVPEQSNIRYVRLENKISLGAKLNLAAKYASGDIIANWDDDDWYAPRRLRCQVEALKEKNAEVCGINNLLYLDLLAQDAYEYVYPADQRVWLLGSSLCYTKQLWRNNHFADINVGMDGLFVWATAPAAVHTMRDATLAVHMIHENNISPKQTGGSWWHRFPAEQIRNIMQDDWHCYHNSDNIQQVKKATAQDANISNTHAESKKIQNIYSCLVHEKEEIVIDQVRNLHYHDPASLILLYNGGNNPKLLKSDFPYAQFNAVVHPRPQPVKHGYLHSYALSAMKFCLDNFRFDTITIVDSDQLCIRSGYTDYLKSFNITGSSVGMLSAMPDRITPDKTDGRFWPALQAFKELDLWKQFLKKFPNGEDKFVHWTFWPSSVFYAAAARDLVKIFREDGLLQHVMRHTKIWATEEVILPTMVSLLGYKIAMNPCSYDYVKYQRSFSVPELTTAMNKKDAFWIHPVERRYDNELRKYTREKSRHYTSQKTTGVHLKSTDMLTTISLLDKIKNIEGWLSDREADLLFATTLKACNELPAPQNIVEIGSYHGKSTVLFGTVVKEYFPASKVYAIDPHEGTVGAVDQGLTATQPSLQAFKKNLQEAALDSEIELIKNYSFNVKWEKAISLLFIDGLHDYPNVAKDFWHFSPYLLPGSYNAFHDYADYYPGVIAFVDELLQTGKYQQVGKAESMVVLQKV